jgi:hypothetical protein
MSASPVLSDHAWRRAPRATAMTGTLSLDR